MVRSCRPVVRRFSATDTLSDFLGPSLRNLGGQAGSVNLAGLRQKPLDVSGQQVDFDVHQRANLHML